MIIKISELVTGESAEGPYEEVMRWVYDMIETFGGCNLLFEEVEV